MTKLTPKEKQRQYRLRRDADTGQDADPVRRAEYLAKRQQSYKQDVAEGRRKLVANMSGRELRHKRKEWKKYQREHRTRQQRERKLLTPPGTPVPDDDHANAAGPSRSR